MRPAVSWQSALNPAGPQAAHIEWLWWLFFWVSTAVFLLVLGSVVWAVLRGRPGGRGTAEARRAGHVVAAASAATVVILFALLAASAVKGHAISSLQRENAITVEVTGRQWWWEVIYLHPEPSRRLTTANEIHIPAGRPVRFRLLSGDVIHSFWVPNLHGKTDLLPGEVTTTWLRADRPGIYRGQCAEFCGLQHAHMALEVIAEPETQFQQWYSRQLGAAPEPSTAEQQRGREVFLNGPCALCHTISGTGAGGRFGPDLTHVAGRRNIAAGTLPFARGPLAGWISNSQAIKPGNNMPPVPLPPADLHALVAYLETLR